MMNSAGPGATGVKKESEREEKEGKMVGERQRQMERERQKKKLYYTCILKSHYFFKKALFKGQVCIFFSSLNANTMCQYVC